MNKSLLMLFLLAAVNLQAQHVGIGNTNPSYKLDISGRIRIRGGTNELASPGIWLNGFGADSVTNKIFMGMESDSSAGFYSEMNATGWFLVANGMHGRLGIRNRNPRYPLSFEDMGGDKISLYRDGNGNYYGLGIGNSTMQLITPHNNSHIVFGHGNSGSFSESMRVAGNGGVGIGTTSTSMAGLTVNKKSGAVHAIFGSNTTGVALESDFPGIGLNSYYSGSRKTIATGYSGYIGVNPLSGGMQLLVSTQSNNADAAGTYKTVFEIKPDGKVGLGVSDPAYLLDVGERMRIRSIPGFTPGIWLNNDANTSSNAFIGMNNDTQVGFYGLGTGWSFLMNTQTGAVAFGGNYGQPGQALISNGTAGAPYWQGIGGGTPNVVRPTSNSPDLVSGGPRVDVPGMVANFTLTAASQVVFQFKLSISNRGCVACGDKRTFIYLVQNIVGGTTDIATTTVYTPNQEIADGVSGPIVVDLPAGTYSFKVSIGSSIYGVATVYARQQEGIMTWQVYPN